MLRNLSNSDGEDMSLVAVDFKDAFKHLVAHPDERRYMCGHISDGEGAPHQVGRYFSYHAVLYGHIAWCMGTWRRGVSRAAWARAPFTPFYPVFSALCP